MDKRLDTEQKTRLSKNNLDDPLVQEALTKFMAKMLRNKIGEGELQTLIRVYVNDLDRALWTNNPWTMEELIQGLVTGR